MEELPIIPFPFPAGTGADHLASQLNPDDSSAILGAMEIVEDAKVIECWNHHELRAHQVILLECEEIENLREKAAKLRASAGYKEKMSRVIHGENQQLEFMADCLSLHDEIRKLVLEIHKFIISRYRNHLSESKPDHLSLISRELRDYVKPSVLLQKTISACDEAVALDADGETIASFVKCLMKSTAPNLSAFVEPIVAAKLVVKAGGVEALAKMDEGEIYRLGGSNGRSIGLLKKSIVYGVAGKVAGIELARGASAAAIADFGGHDPKGGIGDLGKDEMLKKLLKKSDRLRQMKENGKKMKGLESGLISGIVNCMMNDGSRGSTAGTSKLAPKVTGKFKRTKRGNNCDS